mgnify:FL=1
MKRQRVKIAFLKIAGFKRRSLILFMDNIMYYAFLLLMKNKTENTIFKSKFTVAVGPET